MRPIGAVVVALLVAAAFPQVGWSGSVESDSVRLHELEESVRNLQRQVEDLRKDREELKALKQEQQELKERKELVAVKPPEKEPYKFPINFGASITVRYDLFDTEDKADLLFGDNVQRGFRTRDRFWAKYDPDGPVNAGIRLTTGGDPNPTVPFVRFGDLDRSKSFRLDQYYIAVHPLQLFDSRPRREFPVDVSLNAGKMPQPLWLAQWGTWTDELTWDRDINPEGLALKLTSPEIAPHLGVEATGAYFILQEVDDVRFTGLTSDPFMAVGQLVGRIEPVTLGAAYYDYENLNAGFESPSFDPGSSAFVNPGQSAFLLRPGLQRTNNQIDRFGTNAFAFVHDNFRVVNLTGELRLPIPVLPDVGPEGVFVGNWTHNVTVGGDQNGYGLTIGVTGGGKHDSPVNPFNVWFTYRDVDADATLGTFASSDLGLGTAFRGFEGAANYRLHPHLMFQISAFKYKAFPDKSTDITRFYFDLIADF